jgi:hypothetical protein
MPTGPVPLVQALGGGSDLLKSGVIETLIQESPILEQIPVQTIKGNAIKHQVEGTLPDVQFRQVNSTYTRSWGSDTEHFWGVCILGGEVFVDNFIVNTMGNLYSEKAKQFMKFAKSMARTFDKTFFDGDGTGNTFKGVNALVAEGFGMRWNANANNNNGGALTLDDLDEAKDLLRDQSAPDCWLMNRWHRRKIKKLAYTAVTGTVLIDVGTDVFGRRVTMYDDVPFRIIGDDKDGAAILAFDETCGATSNTSSMYAVAYGESQVTGLFGAGGSFTVRDFGETEAAPGHLGRVETYPGIAIFSPFSLVRLAGITTG